MTLSGPAAAFLAALIFLVMLGVGLSLTKDAFREALRARRAIVTVLLCQVVVMPGLCFLLVLALGLPPVLAVGMMLLAASPAGTTAVIFSHLARGNVALNIILTGLTSVLSAITLPVIVSLSIHFFIRNSAGRAAFSLLTSGELIALLLTPIIAGMVIRARRAALASRLAKLTSAVTAVLLALTVVAVVIAEHARILGYLRSSGAAATIFCALSLIAGYLAIRVQRLPRSQAISASMAVGVHNSSLAVAIALSPGLPGHSELAVPATVYAVVAVPVAWLMGRLMSPGQPAAELESAAVAGP
jgi:bile acid:Na+ symporter, BASS family